MNKLIIYSILLKKIILLIILFSINTSACKDIIVCGDASDGDFNLLLKVRDPSRPGFQVLCIVPEGYEYIYRYPWTGKPMNNKFLYKIIGVTTKNDVIPNIVKAGMALSNAGISYGDADTNSGWINPTKYAWDDFDWMRYAYEKAKTEEEALNFLTKEAINKYHATGVSENLFVVGPSKGFVIEADAFNYKIKEIINGIVVMSNYPKELWKTQITKTLPIASSFETSLEKTVRNNQILRLKSIQGIKIIKINEKSIIVKLIPFINALKTKNLGVFYEIKINERETVGPFSVKLIEIINNKAKISMKNKYKDWEDNILSYIEPHYGRIGIKELIYFSRLHSEDLDGLRAMCEDTVDFEAVAIYKIPKKYYDVLSAGWFSPNHACTSIYVPFHICNNDIYEPYKTGEAAELSFNLLKKYGHCILNSSFSKIEEVLINEQEKIEKIAIHNLKKGLKIDDYLTLIDKSMQKQAYLTEVMWLELEKVLNENNKQKILKSIEKIWNKNYSSSLNEMKNSIEEIIEIPSADFFIKAICDIGLDICKSKINSSQMLEIFNSDAEEYYNLSINLIKKSEYKLAFSYLEKAYNEYNTHNKNEEPIIFDDIIKSNYEIIITYIIFIEILLIIIFILIILKKKKNNKYF
jgi:hypothetical protein